MAVVRRLTLALVAGLLWSARLGAQNPVPPTGTITGRVIDAGSQQPIADVSVFVEGTRRGAVSGVDGTFTIGGVPSGSQTVRARRIGFGAPVQIVVVPNGGAVTVVFSLDRKAAVLEEVVTTGYGEQRRLAITGSVSTIDADQAKVAVPTNATNLIEGRAAGVVVTQNSGEPGASAGAEGQPALLAGRARARGVHAQPGRVRPGAEHPARGGHPERPAARARRRCFESVPMRSP